MRLEDFCVEIRPTSAYKARVELAGHFLRLVGFVARGYESLNLSRISGSWAYRRAQTADTKGGSTQHEAAILPNHPHSRG